MLVSDDKWPEAFKVFENRIQSRFFDPIKIIKSNGKNEGEGFSITLISVVLLEFLAAFELGKIYRTNKEGISPHEYYSGIKLLKSFLKSSSVFGSHFDSNTKIQNFYENIRCGLVHEAKTLKNDVIISENSAKNTKTDLLYFSENGEGRLNRDLLLLELRKHINEYKLKITGGDVQSRMRFILKMDEISGLKHIWYFIYGSNLWENQLNNRLSELNEKYLFKQRCSLENYQFMYNKKSTDGTSKANLLEKKNGVVQGVAVLLLEDKLDEFIKKYEIGYKKVEVTIRTGDVGDLLDFKAYTCISNDIASSAPSEHYVSKIVKGANENNLSADYIESVLKYPASPDL